MNETQLELPILPYDGTGGYAKGSATSEARARREAESGELSRRQQAVLGYLLNAGAEGRTWVEAGEALRLHHGQISGALSNLHRAGLIFQVTTKRSKCYPYVHASYRNQYPEDGRRDTPKTRRGARTTEVAPMVARALSAISQQYGIPADSLRNIPEVEALLTVCLISALPD